MDRIIPCYIKTCERPIYKPRRCAKGECRPTVLHIPAFCVCIIHTHVENSNCYISSSSNIGMDFADLIGAYTLSGSV